MKQRLAALAIICCIWGCTTPKHYQFLVTDRLKKNGIPAIKSTESIQLSAAALPGQDTLFTVKSVKSSFVPAIIVWTWNNTMDCKLKPEIAAGYFSESFFRYADSFNLPSLLYGRKLELQLESVPYQYTYAQKGYSIFLLIAAVTKEDNMIVPRNEALGVKYILWNGAIKEKEGSIAVANTSKGLNNNMTSAKKLAWWYLDIYRNNLNKMSRQFARQLAGELNKK